MSSIATSETTSTSVRAATSMATVATSVTSSIATMVRLAAFVMGLSSLMRLATFMVGFAALVRLATSDLVLDVGNLLGGRLLILFFITFQIFIVTFEVLIIHLFIATVFTFEFSFESSEFGLGHVFKIILIDIIIFLFVHLSLGSWSWLGGRGSCLRLFLGLLGILLSGLGLRGGSLLGSLGGLGSCGLVGGRSSGGLFLVISLDVLGWFGRSQILVIELILIDFLLELVGVRLESSVLFLVLIFIVEVIKVFIGGIEETTDVDLTVALDSEADTIADSQVEVDLSVFVLSGLKTGDEEFLVVT